VKASLFIPASAVTSQIQKTFGPPPPIFHGSNLEFLKRDCSGSLQIINELEKKKPFMFFVLYKSDRFMGFYQKCKKNVESVSSQKF
jgi:hypothetical protein